MKQLIKYAASFVLIISMFFIYGCQNNDFQNYISRKYFTSLNEILKNLNTYANAQISSQSSSNAPLPNSGASSNNAGENNDIFGIPEIISTRTYDDGNTLLLVNKYYTVSRDYYPSDMVSVDGTLSTNQGLYLKRAAYEAYLQMLRDAQNQGLDFLICSAYRSYELQKSLYNNSLSQNGEKFTNTRSAYPGRREHHTGLAIDITSESMGYGLSQNFINYPEGLWLNNNCSKYGFIIRYPKGKTHITGYDYEPWHLRYVGTEAASEITAKGITLEEYLGEVQ